MRKKKTTMIITMLVVIALMVFVVVYGIHPLLKDAILNIHHRRYIPTASARSDTAASVCQAINAQVKIGL